MAKPPKAVLSPRSAPDPAAVEAFISGKPASAPEPPLATTAPPAQGTAQPKRTVIRRKDGRELYRTTIYLEPELAQRTGIFAVKQGIDQTDVIKAALSDYLARHGA